MYCRFMRYLPGMPAHERRAIWGLMVYHEGKTRIIYDTYQQAGLNPDKDMLQVSVMPPDRYLSGGFVRLGRVSGGEDFSQAAVWYSIGDLKTRLEGLYVAGESTFAGGNHAVAATTGRYAARNAAAFAKTAKQSQVSRQQVEKEKSASMPR